MDRKIPEDELEDLRAALVRVIIDAALKAPDTKVSKLLQDAISASLERGSTRVDAVVSSAVERSLKRALTDARAGQADNLLQIRGELRNLEERLSRKIAQAQSPASEGRELKRRLEQVEDTVDRLGDGRRGDRHATFAVGGLVVVALASSVYFWMYGRVSTSRDTPTVRLPVAPHADDRRAPLARGQTEKQKVERVIEPAPAVANSPVEPKTRVKQERDPWGRLLEQHVSTKGGQQASVRDLVCPNGKPPDCELESLNATQQFRALQALIFLLSGGEVSKVVVDGELGRNTTVAFDRLRDKNLLLRSLSLDVAKKNHGQVLKELLAIYGVTPGR